MTLGERVLLLRRRRKLTQGALAQAVGVAKNTISRLEQGRIDDVQGHTIAQLARALDVTTDYLLGMAEDEDVELVAAVAV
jgi:transcriptional regulator with XRE-family HTH domain